MARRTPNADPHLRDLLTSAADAARAETLAAARKFQLAAAWAEAHPAPVEDRVVDDDGYVILYGDQPITIAGEGAPGMSEFAVAEFAAACGMTAHQGRAFIGAAVEAKYRLPGIWARVVAGEVAVWNARRVTERTHRLTPAGAAHVDTELAPVLHTCSFAQIERAAETAAAEADGEHEELERLGQATYVNLDYRAAPHCHGKVPLDGMLDYPDAKALDAFLKTRAKQLGEKHPELDLDTRRAMALGRLNTKDGGTGSSTTPERELVVYAHHTPDAGHGIVDIEQLGPLTVEELTEWCHYAATKVTIRPILDLAEEITVDRYRPTDQQREQAILTTPTCVFPGCNHHARGCDLDHIEPWRDDGTGGRTTSWNLAPLCRLHHRMKTHGNWTYTRTSRTSFEWTSPSSRTHFVDLTYKRRRTR